MPNNKQKIPFRYDIVGSFLRPESLKNARASYANGDITKQELTKVEDQAIIALINKQKAVGLHAVTDGEFRRRWWHLDFIAGLNGITVYDFQTTAFGISTEAQGTYVSGPLSFSKDHPFLDHFRFTQKHASPTLAKQTIPGPNMIFLDSLILSKQYNENPIYDSLETFKQDLITTYQEAIQAFYDAGCRYLQLDDTSWGGLFDDRFRELIKTNGLDADQLLNDFQEITEKSLAKKPADLAVTFHFCKGNFQSHWLYNGTYETIAKNLFSIEAFDGFFLEYDDERSGGFEPLKELQNQRIVLGLVTTKNGQLEDPSSIIKRINDASKFIPLEQICLSPQCGFASTHEGNHLTEEDQWQKIKLVKTIAETVWQDA
ncbi:5-methyltetrahydropteroyltriglutamate-homocysteine methyltransferase [Enterococcus sp. DIV0212c]|uniref:5-methyltetrahydropteroyltriglutamate-- homocysteine S-methyltransferase n=1 Tax=Enterococcus sp. DIV0212c TaxID=2230867 RepID=UPI001A9BEF98|nr:5-methyltetrahydropteroyltriglutamate--homocysteine S-methyltransferase [Enterococcus sp. DIV0212c]MBO1353287.1 5-methyltetrahydropteroyltriglutamate--homocysteine S-methyltransferase [Enterococcus sp. DIV0212c]